MTGKMSQDTGQWEGSEQGGRTGGWVEVGGQKQDGFDFVKLSCLGGC